MQEPANEWEENPRTRPNELEPPAVSPAVRLELAFLHAEPSVSHQANAASLSGGQRRVVLVASPDSNMREYVRECLRSCDDVQLIECATIERTVEDAVLVAARVLILDLKLVDVLVALPVTPAIVVVDELPRSHVARNSRLRVLPRPFSGEELASAVREMLNRTDG